MAMVLSPPLMTISLFLQSRMRDFEFKPYCFALDDPLWPRYLASSSRIIDEEQETQVTCESSRFPSRRHTARPCQSVLILHAKLTSSNSLVISRAGSDTSSEKDSVSGENEAMLVYTCSMTFVKKPKRQPAVTTMQRMRHAERICCSGLDIILSFVQGYTCTATGYSTHIRIYI